MAKLGWITDPHLNLIGTSVAPDHFQVGGKLFGSPQDFGAWVRAKYPDLDAVVLSGDLAEALSVEKAMKGFIRGFKGPGLFVFGNHDYYHGSFEGVHKAAAEWATGDLVWLRQAGVFELTPDVAVCGNEGWYDGRAADPLKSRIMMTDFHLIQNFRHKHALVVHHEIRLMARMWAEEAMVPLREACTRYKQVFFVTHVPPFPDAAWHEGKPSDSDWLPWMCNVTLGDYLIQMAYEFQGTKITVLCGHTHSPGEYQAAPNLTVLTGKSEYWYPQVSRVFDLDSPQM